ncbi:MAG: GDSL-type esterase/lipase family protein, partial [Burkholderiaceae bacterium]
MRRRNALRAALHCSLLALPGWAGAQAGRSAAAPPAASAKRLVVLGDSLSAEYGLARGSGWVALLDQRLAAEKRGYTVVNASISGDTTAGGRSRLPRLLEQHRPTHLIIELGGNDALRGLPVSVTEA